MKCQSDRTWGVEIECYVPSIEAVVRDLREAGVDCRDEGYSHRTRTWWKVVSDCSLDEVTYENGQRIRRCPIPGYESVEFVSPPMSGDAGLSELRTVCAILNRHGAKILSKCGLHVHHEARGLGIHAWRELLLRYATCETLIDTAMPKSRRGSESNYAKSLRDPFYGLEDMKRKILRANTLEDLQRLYNRDRYYKINLDAYVRHGTVEFRQHSGTVEFAKIAQWVIFTQAMIVKSLQTPCRGYGWMDREPTWRTLVWCIDGAQEKKEVMGYFQKRAERLQ